MSKKTKIWLVIGASFILVGCMLFGGIMAMLKWDFTKLSTNKFVTNDYEISEDYKNISINNDTADILFLPSENGETSVSCKELENLKHSVSVKDETLVIELNDTRKWYEYIGINFGSSKITVYMPADEYGNLFVKESTGNIDLPKDFSFESIDISTSTGDVKSRASASGSVKIKTSTGHICAENISAGDLDLSVTTGDIKACDVKCDGDLKIRVTTGKIYLSDVACKSLTTNGSTGNVSLKNVIASGKFSIERSTGDVKFEKCDASEIFVKTDTGKVKGSLLSDKVFITSTDTGSVSVPKSTAGGRCEIETDTGDIRITIE